VPYRLLEWIPAVRRVQAETLVAMGAAQPYFRRYDESPGANH
jgi:hypothetical protein